MTLFLVGLFQKDLSECGRVFEDVVSVQKYVQEEAN